jgi:hypothetical protein
MDRVYIVTMDDVKAGTFSTYDKAMDFIQDCRAVKPYAQYGIEEVPVDTAIAYRVDYTTSKLVYTAHFNSNGDLTGTGAYYRVFGDEVQAMKQGTEVWETVVGGVVATSLDGFDDAIARGKAFLESLKDGDE